MPLDLVAGSTRLGPEHRATGVREIHFPLTVRNEHAVRAQEVGAEQHIRCSHRPSRYEALALVGREPPDIGKADPGIAYKLIADAEVSGVTPSAAACDFVTTDEKAPESSNALTGRPLISTVSSILGDASKGASNSTASTSDRPCGS